MLKCKSIMVGLLILNILGSALLYPLVYLDFSIRREYIQKVLCIEKDNPITVCKGSCYLAKRLNQAAKHEQKEKQLNQKRELNFFSQELFNVTTSSGVKMVTLRYKPFDEQIPINPFAFDIFHPPRITCS